MILGLKKSIIIRNKSLDLALRKSISAVNGNTVINSYNLTENRLPKVTGESALTALSTGNAEYYHNKEAIEVNKNDEITYTIRVYNEGNENDYCGYAKEITDYLPEGLTFVKIDESSNSNWQTTSKEGDSVVKLNYTGSDTIFNNSLFEIYKRNYSGNTDMTNMYQTVSIICKVNDVTGYLTNRAEITTEVATDENGTVVEGVTDRDSTPGSLNENDTNLKNYYNYYNVKYGINDTYENFYPGEENGKKEDDTDFETVVIKAPETIDVSGTKTWNDEGNKDKTRPEKITIYLLANGTQVDAKEISEKDGWKYSFTGLAKYDDNKQEIKYTVDESEVEKYTKQVNGYDIVNTYTPPETIDVSGTKTWNDEGNKDKTRPEKITIYLLANGTQVDAKEISEKDGWKYSFTGLAKYDDNKQEIKYTIDESEVEKYTKQINGYDLINTYTTYRDDEPLKELLLNIYKYIQSSPFPEDWLNEKVEMFNLKDKLNNDFSETVWGKILLDSLKENISNYIISLKKTERDLNRFEELEKFRLVINEDIINLEYVKENLNSWNSAYEKANQIEWPKWPTDKKVTLELKDIAKSTRDGIKKSYNKEVSKILLYDSAEANENIYNMYGILKAIENLIIEFSKKFAERKKEKNIVDFNDIEHFALKILLKNENGKIIETDIAKKYKEKFVEIAIDEYQDSNLVQEYILTSVSKGNNIFMVGDVKQSIYKFRQARPELFLNKYEKYKLKGNDLSNGQKIQLFKNFRSRSNILDVTNMIFENIMSKSLGDILYDETEFLNLGADYKNPETDLINYAGKTELNIIDLKDEEINVFKDSEEDDELPSGAERIEDVVLEARFVANKIKSFLNSGYMVFDKKTKEYRNVTYKDIVVLLRATSVTAPIYENEIAKLSFPVFSDVSSEYLESLEIQTIMSVLKVVDNPMQDIPLVTVLRSTIGGFSDNDLVEIRLKNKNQPFYKSLKEYDGDDKLKTKINIFLKNTKYF